MKLSDLQQLVQSINDHGFMVHWNYDTGEARLMAWNHDTGLKLFAEPCIGPDAFRSLAAQATATA